MGMFDHLKSWINFNPQNNSNTQKAKKQIDLLDTAVRPLFRDDDILTNRNRTLYYLQRMGLANLSMWDLFYLSRQSDILQIIFGARNREIFRNGYDIETLNELATDEQYEEIENWIKNCNENNQSLTEVLQEWSKDLDWADDAYLLVSKDYYINGNDELVGGKVKEILRLNPLTVEMVLDSKNRLGYSQNDIPVYFNIQNRSELLDEPFNDETGLPNIQAHYKVGTSDGAIYYNESEILHKSVNSPSPTYGYSPLYSFYKKLMILLAQDDYIYRYYGENRPLRDLLFVNTTNAESFWMMWDKLLAKKKRDPHSTFPIIGENSNGQLVNHVDLNKTMQEMQYTETRQELRNQIGAFYGVSPIFQNDTSTSGGLNNEGLQITVTNRAVQDRQTLINTTALPFIFRQNLGINNYEVTLKPSQEQDDMHELNKELLELNVAKTKLELGLKGKYIDGELIFENGDLTLEDTAQTDSFNPFSSTDSAPEDSVDKSMERIAKANNPKQAKEWGNQLQRELTKLLEKIDFKRKPTESELNDIVSKNIAILQKKLRVKSSNKFKAIYRDELKKMSDRLHIEPVLTKQDKNAIELLKRDPTFQKSFAGLSASMADNVRNIITKAYDNPEDFTINKLVQQMSEEVTAKDAQLRNIARTETGKISSAARINSYEKAGGSHNYLFKHIGPNDHRTTECSKRIVERTKDGVSWQDYLKIMKEESSKYFPKWTVNESAPLSHYQSRHTFIGVRVPKK